MKKTILITTLILLVFTNKSLAETKNVTRQNQSSEGTENFLTSVLGLLGGVYTSTAVHEFGHYNTAEHYGLESNITLGIIKTNDGGNLSYYLGKTTYNSGSLTNQIDDGSQIKAELALAGMESSRKMYSIINENIQRGTHNDRFSSLIALISRTEFSRYALVNGLKKNPDQLDDIEAYSTNSGVGKNFIYSAAILDILFSWDEINFHAKRVLGKNPAIPKHKEIFGIEASPEVFISSNSGMTIGFTLKW
ncbi:MAG: hypothetical protein V1872_08145 [bacterium]